MAHESRTFYEVLGIPQEADVSEVRAAWRREVREWHPDQFSEGNRGDAERRAQAINEAYATLRDPMRRERYDARLAYHAAAAAAARPTAEPRRDARLHARRSRERDVRTAPEPVSVSSFVRDVKTASQRHP